VCQSIHTSESPGKVDNVTICDSRFQHRLCMAQKFLPLTYQTFWHNVRDWVIAQLALYETEIVDMPQVFLPIAMMGR
jgi:hypothetical protein